MVRLPGTELPCSELPCREVLHRPAGGVLDPLAGLLDDLVTDQSGATSIEYALIGTLVSIFIIGSLQAYQSSLVELFTYIKDTVLGAMGG
ncbi:MAG: Flp family type IVb pilin [Deltaproteobacteria bacterium]|nr:MAG: Flp family type IVb pilin [Deltaproteobacteria bacterium]